MGSWKEGVDSGFPDGKTGVHVHFPRLCRHNGSSPVRSQAWQTLGPMTGLACKGRSLELGSQNVPDRWRKERGSTLFLGPNSTSWNPEICLLDV